MKRLVLNLVMIFVLTSCYTYPYLYHLDNVDNMFVNRKIAIMPCNLIYENKYSKNSIIRTIIEDSIKIRFQKFGFEVINPYFLNKDIDSIKSKFGGFYDVKTGEIDTSKVNGFRRDLMQHIFTKYGITSFLFPNLVIVKAFIQNGGYCWDGRFVHSFGIGNTFGQTSALSLYVQIYDAKEKMIFDNAGGIQPLYKVQSFEGFIEPKDDEILKKSKDLSKALHIIFKPINEKLNYKNAL